MKTFLTVLITLFLMGCSKRPITVSDYEKIKIGMTYDEVVNAMTRPEVIMKGVTTIEFKSTPEYQQLEDSEKVALEKAKEADTHDARDKWMSFSKYHLDMMASFLERIQRDSLHWQEPTISTQGQLIQTTWYLPEAPIKRDTIKVAIPAGHWTKAETLTTIPTTKYYELQDNKTWIEISKETYQLFTKYDYDKIAFGGKYKKIQKSNIKAPVFIPEVKMGQVLFSV